MLRRQFDSLNARNLRTIKTWKVWLAVSAMLSWMVFVCGVSRNMKFVYSMIPAESEMSFPEML